MRRKNWRLVLTGVVLILLALIFYFLMLNSASRSTDPQALMEIVGGIAGAAFGISILFILVGLVGKKA